MKMRLLWISVVCLYVGLANGDICSNGVYCEYECCPLLPDISICCKTGCRFGFGCNSAPENAQLYSEFIINPDIYFPRSESKDGADPVMESNIFFPRAHPKDISYIEESSKEKIQMGFIKKILTKILATDPEMGFPRDALAKDQAADPDLQMGLFKKILTKVLSTDPKMGFPRDTEIQATDPDMQMGFLRDTLTKVQATDPDLQMGIMSDILRKILGTDPQMGSPKGTSTKILPTDTPMGFLKIILNKILASDPQIELLKDF